MRAKYIVTVGSLQGLFLRGAEDPVEPVVPPADPPQDDGDGTENPDPTATPPEPKTFSEEYVQKLRQEAAGLRTERNTLKKEKDDAAKAKLDEVDRLKLEKEEAETRTKEVETALAGERIANAIARAAATANFHAPDDAAAFIKTTEIKLNDDGSPDMRSITAAVKKLGEDKPHLVRGLGSADGGAQGALPSDAQKTKAYEKELADLGMVKV